jgi:hypothetical protein
MALQLDFIADQDQFQFWMSIKTRVRRTHDHLGAEVAAHGIE